MWLSFKEIYKNKKFLLILILVFILWIILLNIVYITSNGGFNLADSDGYIVLLQAKAWGEILP